MGPKVMPIEDFMVNDLLLLDDDIQDRITRPTSNGNVLHYVCLIENTRCEVGVQELPKDSPLGRLRGSDNLQLKAFNMHSGGQKIESYYSQSQKYGNVTLSSD